MAPEETVSLLGTREEIWIVEDTRDLDPLGGERHSIEHHVHATPWSIPTSPLEAIEALKKGVEGHRGRLRDFPDPRPDQGVHLHDDDGVALQRLRGAHPDDGTDHIHLPRTNALPEVETATAIAREARHHRAIDNPIRRQINPARPALDGADQRRRVHRHHLVPADAGRLPDHSVDQGRVLRTLHQDGQATQAKEHNQGP